MKTVCYLNQCNGCMACVDKCSKNAIEVVDEISCMNAFIDNEKCVHCNQCFSVCPNNTLAELEEPILWKQGWANNTEIRKHSSSGGVASAIMESFIHNGGYVCSCKYVDGQFVFICTNNNDEISLFRGSKYVKSNARGIYREIERLLCEGERVLFIGLPCQSAALKNYISSKYYDSLYRVDLICHGTPSSRILQAYLKEKRIVSKDVINIQFRNKNDFSLIVISDKNSSKPIVDNSYMHAFLNCEDYTLNCYNCRYAQKMRCSDVTLGDSWGTELTNEEKNGISLILCSTKKGIKLIDEADLNLFPVDIQRAITYNKQLNSPSKLPNKRYKLIEGLRKGNKFSTSFFITEPYYALRQHAKVLVRKLQSILRE